MKAGLKISEKLAFVKINIPLIEIRKQRVVDKTFYTLKNDGSQIQIGGSKNPTLSYKIYKNFKNFSDN